MCRRVRFPYGGILMEFRGLYETGIKTRNIRSVARLSDCYGRLKSKAVLGLLTARGATIKFVGISLKSDSKLRKLCSKLIFDGSSVCEMRARLSTCFWPPVIIKNLRITHYQIFNVPVKKFDRYTNSFKLNRIG